MVGDVMAAAVRRVEAAKQRPNERRRRMSQLYSGLTRDEIVDVQLDDVDDDRRQRRLQDDRVDATQPAAAPQKTTDSSAPASECESYDDDDDDFSSDSRSTPHN